MRKKLLAGVMALALCSTNMLPQAIFAGEFTSGNLEEVTEETPEIFTDEEQDTAKEASEDISVFSPEDVPAFSDETENVLAATQGEGNGEINLSDDSKVDNTGSYIIDHAGKYSFTSNESVTANRIVIQKINSDQGKVEIHLNNLKINTSNGPALHIMDSVNVEVLIYLQGNNELITTNKSSAGLQKNNGSLLTIKNESDNVIGHLDASNEAMDQPDPSLPNPEPAGYGAGIGSGKNGSTVSNICISGVSVTASSTYGAGIGSGQALGGENSFNTSSNCSNISISNSTVTATSTNGAGIGSGGASGSLNSSNTSGNCSDITISNSTVTATSTESAGIGSGRALGGAGCTNISGNCSDIFISGGSVNSSSIDCPPLQPQNRSPLYLCKILNTSSSLVTIDDKTWTPSSHLSDGNLYAWLTGEDHFVTVGSENRCYIFTSDTFTQQGKHTITINDFNFNPPTDLTYDGNTKPVTVSPKVSFKDMAKNIIVKYFLEDKLINGLPVNAGDYTVKIAVVEGEFYNSTTGDLSDPNWSFTINKSDNTPNFPSENTISVPWSCKKVNEIDPDPLPENWEWHSSDKIKDLNVGDNTATAIYTGKDANKGNYNTETVTYIITREACKHPHTTERYYSSPSCTSSGYSGDTYCADCGVLISSGYTISAYGHDYDNGVITTEPTAEIDGIITYTCKRCKHQDAKNLGKLGDGEPYIEGSFQKKGWDAVNDLIKASKEKNTISITLNGTRTLPASVLSGIKGKDISLNLDMENGFIWKINGTSITSETPADTDLSVTNTAEYIPAALYSLISTNQNDFGFHLGRSGAFDFPAVLSVKADASCAGLMANLFWYDVENGVLQCIQTVTVGGAFERSIPYADFTLSKGQDYFIAFGTESLNGRVIHTDGSITDENGAYLRPANTKISSYSIDRNKLTVKLSKGCAGAQGYDFVISKKSNMLQTGKFSKTVSSTGKPQASFRYLAKGTWYVAARSWVLDAQGNKVYGSWTKIKKIKITVVTPQQPKIRNITVEGNTVTITYTKCKNATGYEILLGNKYKTSAGEKYPVKKYVKRTEGKNTVTVTFTNVKKGNWYVTVRSWNRTSKNKSRVYSPYSTMKKFKTKK
ncbi:hypothetical protein ABHA60_13510 [Blautia wexlerae]|uniref:hypothetical protein n=1 Tax=Blautia wexlerae TaxID=418240 RepID=UPI00325BD5CD